MDRTLHLVTSGRQSLSDVLRIVEAAVRGGIDYLHLREKARTARELAQWVEALSVVIPRERILVNDRVDVAAALQCGGCHLAHHSLPVDAAKRVLDRRQLAGCSVHSREEAEEAVRLGADYLFFGHVFASGSKPGLPPRGTAELAQVTRAAAVPVIAIGGVTPERVRELRAAGAAGIAVLSGITDAVHPLESAQAYRSALDHA